MTAKELKSGKEVNYNKFVVGYDKKNKLYYARKHGSAGQIFTDYTFARLKEFISGSGGKLLKVKSAPAKKTTVKTGTRKKTVKKVTSSKKSVNLRGTKTANVTERVKTFGDACNELNINFDESNLKSLGFTSDEIALRKLKIITEALNEGWKANWKDSSQNKYIPFFKWFASGLAFGGTAYYYSGVMAGDASRLCFKTAALAEYAGKTFTKIYSQFIV
jgi:hypothetical protein